MEYEVGGRETHFSSGSFFPLLCKSLFFTLFVNILDAFHLHYDIKRVETILSNLQIPDVLSQLFSAHARLQACSFCLISEDEPPDSSV